jgi:hypothetical protein
VHKRCAGGKLNRGIEAEASGDCKGLAGIMQQVAERSENFRRKSWHLWVSRSGGNVQFC